MPLLQSALGDDAIVLREGDFQILLLATIFPILGTGLISPILDSLIEPFGATPGNIGLMIAFVTAPAIVFIPVSGFLADRYGRKVVLIVALLLFGAGGSAIAFTTDFHVALALRGIQGIGFAGIVPIITASIGDLYRGRKEVTGQGLRLMANGLSGTVFPLLAGMLVIVAWQYPFLLYATAFPVAAIVYVRFNEPATPVDTDRIKTDRTAYLRSIFTLLSYRRAAAIVVGRGLPLFIWVGFLTFNSLIVIRVMGGTPIQAGALVAVGNLCFAAGASQVARLVEFVGNKFQSLITTNFMMAIGFFGFLFSPTASFSVPWVALTGAGMGLSISLYRSYITELSPTSLRAGVVSLGASGARVSATVSPILMGLFIEYATPAIGQTLALQLAGVGVAIIGGFGGIACLLIAARSAQIPTDRLGRGSTCFDS